jgi:predicted MFS family arabinose efflux permease
MTGPKSGAEGGLPIPAKVARPRYALFILTLAYILSQMDRNIVNILLDPIKKDLNLTDTQLGLLTGFAFVIFYSTMGLPIARLADRTSRSLVLSGGLFLWSLMTFLSGFAQSFAQLGLARMAVGVGEANSGASVALISEHFGDKKRPRAMAVYTTAIFLGPFAAYTVGGWVNQWYGWRAAFMVAGVPGIILALVVFFTLSDPPLGSSESGNVDKTLSSVKGTIAFLFSQKTYVTIFLNGALVLFGLHGMQIWAPSLLRRVHHLSSAEIGSYAGTMQGVLGIGGSLAAGWLVGTLSGRSARWHLLVPACALVLASVAMTGFALSDSVSSCLIAYGFTVALLASAVPTILSVIQNVVRVRMRSFATSAAFFTSNLFGLGLGSVLIGMSNDALQNRFGDAGIRYSLLIPASCLFVAGCIYGVMSRCVAADMDRVRRPSAEPPGHPGSGLNNILGEEASRLAEQG